MNVCGICGSDLMDWYLTDRAPLILGHEPAGVIVEAGADVKDFKEGDRVFVHHHVPCLTCHYCVRGAYTMSDQYRKTHIDPGRAREIHVTTELLHYDEINLLGSFHANPSDFRKALNLIASGAVQVRPLLTKELPLRRISDAFNVLTTSKEELKIAIIP